MIIWFLNTFYYINRATLVARVFNIKKKAFLKDILQNGVLGKTVAHVYTIEFQV